MSAEPSILGINYIYLLVAAWVAFLLVIIFYALKQRGKIMIRIKIPGLPEKIVRRKPILEGQKTMIIMRPDSKKQAGWKFSFDSDCLVPKRGWLRQYYALDVKPEAPRACSWRTQTPDADQPELTKKEAKKYAQAEFFKVHYMNPPKPISTTAVAIIALLVVANLVVTGILFLQSRGVKIG